jgi:Tol biopolymer transport system component
MRRILFLILLILVLAGCSLLEEESPTPTLPALEISAETPSPSPTFTEAPSATPTTTPTQTPEVPPTPLPTEVPAVPTITPFPAAQFLNDQFQEIEIPAALSVGLDTSWLAFTNYNDRARPSAAATLETPEHLQTLYLTRSDTRQRVEIAEIPISAGERIFWSPTGQALAYFVENGLDEAGNVLEGLYVLDFRVGLRYRLLDITNLNPRGIPGHVPVWSADGTRLALALPTEYATDIYIVTLETSDIHNITSHGSYDLWPVFSPDGQWLAFVSDRLRCPTWVPGEEGSCGQVNATPPTSGNLFILNLETGETRQITDLQLNGPPHWITPTKLEFSTGGGNALAETSDIWLIDIEAGSAVQINTPGTLSLGEHWTDDASRVVYQQAGDTTTIIVANAIGGTVATSTDYGFPRFGMAADWSPDGQFLAIGGRGGQCPYGLLVVDPNFQVVTEPARNLLACNPTYTPSGRYLAFMGIRTSSSTDGRLDIYIANSNGLGATNITQDLQGEKALLGWVGVAPTQ